MKPIARYLILPAVLALLSGTAWGHDPYTKWQQSNGASCCNKTDCRPAKVRFNVAKWQVLLHGRWCDIPADKVRDYKSPDGGPHICAPLTPHYSSNPCEMFCFVHGETKG